MAISDGWNEDKLQGVISVLEDIYNAEYEIKSCRRGAYSDAYTYEELGDHLIELAERLRTEAEYVKEEEEDPDEDEEGEETDPDARIGGDY